jgi:hypothetical protein
LNFFSADAAALQVLEAASPNHVAFVDAIFPGKDMYFRLGRRRKFCLMRARIIKERLVKHVVRRSVIHVRRYRSTPKWRYGKADASGF